MAKRKVTSKQQAIQKAARRQKARKKKSLWRLEDGLTFSALSSWNENPEAFALKYLEGLTPKKISEPLEFGSIIHLALEHQEEASPTEVINKVCANYRKWRKETLTNSTQVDQLDRLMGLAAVTFPQYCQYWLQDDKKIEWVAREEKFEVPYDVPGRAGLVPRRVLLKGMRDGVYRNKAGLGIFETKTKSRISDQEILEGLQADMQTMFYLVATMLEKGETPLQVKYNVIRRSGIKFRKNDNLDDYLRRVEDDIVTRPDHYFKRYLVTITEKDVTNFINRTLNPQLVLFLQWWDSVKNDPSREGRFRSPYHHLNCINLIGKYGKTDMFEAIFGRRTGYFYRKTAHPELHDSIQITWN